MRQGSASFGACEVRWLFGDQIQVAAGASIVRDIDSPATLRLQPHLAHLEGCAAPRIVLITVPRVSRSCEHFPDGFDLHLLHRC